MIALADAQHHSGFKNFAVSVTWIEYRVLESRTESAHQPRPAGRVGEFGVVSAKATCVD